MFNETFDGQTHYENDNCGDPAHNLKYKLDYFIRDVTKVGSIPKSEIRRRLEEMVGEIVGEDRKNYKRLIEDFNQYKGYNQAKSESRTRAKERGFKI